MILTDGVHVFGVGETEQESIADAIGNCYQQDDVTPVSEAWIAEQISIGKQTEYKHGLWFDAE